MATATKTFKNFIDGESVDAAEGGTDAVLNPATGEEIAQAPSSTQEDVERAVKAARAAFEGGWGTSTPGRALAGHPQAGRRARGARRRDRRARVGQRRQADRGLQGRRGPGHGRQPALLRRRRALHGGQGGGRVPRGLHLDDPPRAGRRHRPDRAVELPDHDGRLEDRPGAGHRQHDRPQAGADHAAEHDPARRDRVGVPAQGRAQRHRRRQRPRRGAGRARRRRHGLAHRLGRDRQVDRRARGQDAEEGPPRARRQGAGRRLRRRRPRLRARDDRRHRLLQRRPGLHGGHARAGLQRDPRRRRQRPGQGGRRLRHGRHELGRHDARPAELGAPARARRGLPRAPALARRDRHRRQGARPARLLPAADGRDAACSRTTR